MVRQLTLPNSQYLPSHSLEFLSHLDVAGYVVTEFIVPEVDSAFRCISIWAIRMPVPETAVYEKNRMILRQNYIGCTGERPDVETESIAHSMKY